MTKRLPFCIIMALLSWLPLLCLLPRRTAQQQCQPALRRGSCEAAGRHGPLILYGSVGNPCCRPLERAREHDSPESLPGMQRGFRFLNYQLAIPRLQMSA